MLALLALLVFAGIKATDQGMKYEGFVTIILTALGVMLAVLAIVIATVAIWGYQGMLDRASRDAKEAAELRIAEHIKSKDIKTLIEQEIRMRVIEAVQQRVEPQPPPAGERQAVAEEYPPERA